MAKSRLTKLFLRAFIVSIAATAVVGIVAILAPTGYWVEVKILLTTATIAAASVCGLACGGCLTRGHTILPTAGLVLTGVAAILLLFGLWTELTSEIYWKVSWTVSIFAIACAHLSMLFMANLAGGYRWAYLVAFQLIFGLAALLSAAVDWEFFEDESFWRLTGVISILVAAITLMIPVFHHLSREYVATARVTADPVFAVDEEIARLKKRLMELESRRRVLLGREGQTPAQLVANAADESSPARPEVIS